MRQPVKNYANTSVHWGKTQSDIMKMLTANGIGDSQFTNISYETALKSGLVMDEGSIAIMLVFQKPQQIADGVSGNVPVRIIVPSVPNDEKAWNQYYRLLYWYLKSKFEAIQTGLVEFAEEFMPHLQIASGTAFGRLWEKFRPGYYKALETGQQPDAKLLPSVSDDSGGEEL